MGLWGKIKETLGIPNWNSGGKEMAKEVVTDAVVNTIADKIGVDAFLAVETVLNEIDKGIEAAQVGNVSDALRHLEAARASYKIVREGARRL